MGDLLIAFLSENQFLKGKTIKKFGFKDFPACGTYEEVLAYHKLDYNNLANQIIEGIKMIKIGKRKISSNNKPLIVAEVGINHFGSLN